MKSETKKCRKCGRVLPVEAFVKDKGSKDGHGIYCKDCYNKYQVERNKAIRHKREVRSLAEVIMDIEDDVIINEFKRRGFRLVEGNIYKAM